MGDGQGGLRCPSHAFERGSREIFEGDRQGMRARMVVRRGEPVLVLYVVIRIETSYCRSLGGGLQMEMEERRRMLLCSVMPVGVHEGRLNVGPQNRQAYENGERRPHRICIYTTNRPTRAACRRIEISHVRCEPAGRSSTFGRGSERRDGLSGAVR
jgi:hypothetical protein